MLARLLLLLAALFGLAGPAYAQADDISAASRSVVRVAVAAFEGEEIVDFGHGSGFAVGPNRIVTNAHVVALAVADLENVRIGIIPAEGSPPAPARIIAVDPARDLALLELQQGRLPAAVLFSGGLPAGAAVAALGYPGNVDLATAQSFEDLLQPRPPSRSMGNYSDMRPSPVGPSMVHTADIARGHSGGPLVDACGRVVGVNVALTGNEGGDASFGFAIPVSSLLAFLREAGQPARVVAATCVSAEARQRAEADRAERERQAREADEAARTREADQRRARLLAQIEEERETRLYIAILLLVLSLAAMGTGGILLIKNKNGPAIAAGVIALFLLVASAVLFLTRPSLSDADREEGAAAEDGAQASRFVGANLCRLDAERSRVTVSDARPVQLAFEEGGCVNGSTQYARDGAVWKRVLVPNEEATVTVSEFDPASGDYIVSRYLLGTRAMEEARRLRRRIEQKACTTDEEAKLRMADQQRELIGALPDRPNERLVYACQSIGG